MFAKVSFTKENLNEILSALAKEFRKLNGTKMPAEIILIGGASILANYGFRNLTYDVDAIIHASSAMKEAINRVGDLLNLPNGWLNTDFKYTKSYSAKLTEISVYYREFSNILTVRTVKAEYLLAMKLMSGRQYKNDLSDIVGVLWEHKKGGNPMTMEDINKAVNKLYGGWKEIPLNSVELINDIFAYDDYEGIYYEALKNENIAQIAITEIEKEHPGILKEVDFDTIIERAKLKHK